MEVAVGSSVAVEVMVAVGVSVGVEVCVAVFVAVGVAVGGIGVFVGGGEVSVGGWVSWVCWASSVGPQAANIKKNESKTAILKLEVCVVNARSPELEGIIRKCQARYSGTHP